ncbi:Uncharacterised protein [Chlamydia abortus]|nr:Uncharacterised protein [Chlamydia abortus]
MNYTKIVVIAVIIIVSVPFLWLVRKKYFK